jgi:outer membrane receptor protein involved in Fe transport
MQYEDHVMKTQFLRGTLLTGSAIALLSFSGAFAQDDASEDQTETIIVRGQYIPEPQRETSQVASFLEQADLERQGDANAALALTRLSGISIVSDRFAYVRGLGDRYSAALLNGSPLPSPEPLRRTVPLDLFPSSILSGAAVQKTYSANYPAEFGGGLIDLQTVGRPRDNFLDLKIGSSFNAETTLQKGIFARGSDTDWWGYDDGLRDIPGPLAAVLSSPNSLNSFTPAEIEVVGESLTNSPLSVIQRDELPANVNFSADGGLLIDGNGYDLGLVGVVGFSSGWTSKNMIRQFVAGDILGNDLRSEESTYSATTNAFGSATLGFGAGHEIQANVLYVHDTDKEAQITTGRDFNAPGATGEVFDESTGWFERALTYGQLRGEHEFGSNWLLNWRASAAQSTRDAPYERSLRRLVDETGVPRYAQANNYSIRFSDLTDDMLGFGADLAYDFELPGGREATFTGGIDSSSTERAYNFYGFRFAGGNTLPLDVQIARPDFLFSPDNIDATRFVLQENTSTNDSYAGELDVMSGFGQLDFDVTDFIRATVGVRYEEGEQLVRTFDRFGNPGAGDVDLQNEYVLPALTLTWNFADDLQLRLGYSQTIARPQFRELALSSYFDPETERAYRGNSGLVDSELTNYDARLEYYLGRNQFVTAAGFYKEIENPIEEVQFETSTFVFETTFFNSPKAILFGGELEYRTRFDFPGGIAFFEDRDGLFAINYTYTKAEIEAEPGTLVFDPISRSQRDVALFNIDGAPLQGTPENILNVQLGWQSSDEQLTLLLGWVDERILQRGIDSPGSSLPDIIEVPGVQLDLVYNRDLEIAGRDFTFGLSGRNLLDEAHEEYQVSDNLGRTEFNTYDRGQTVSASITAKF